MFTLQLNYENRNEYQVYASEWATKQIAKQWLAQDEKIQKAYIINHDTCEVEEITR